MTKAERAIKATKYLREYCQSMPIDCEGCIFDKNDPDAMLWKGCLLNDPDHLPETWELEKVKTKAKN